MGKFRKFTSIESFHNVVKKITKYYANTNKVVYRGKVTLHGTNAGVCVNKDGIIAQSRNHIITPEKDNAGFARWVEFNRKYFEGLSRKNVTIYGEWCGPGIMNGTAVNKIPNKIFAVFGISINDGKTEDSDDFIVEPDMINLILGELPENMYVIPWQTEKINVHFSNIEQLREVAEVLNDMVESIEQCDPFIKDTFGEDGICEGLVFYAQNTKTASEFSNYVFKAKGEKHKASKTKKSVTVGPEILNSIKDFTTMFVTENRVNQAISEVGLDIKNTGTFLKWISNDIIKESADELDAAGLNWKQVSNEVCNVARGMYIDKCRKL